MQQILSIICHRKRVHVPLNEQVFRWALCVCIYMYDGVCESVCSCILSLRCVFTPAHGLDHRNHSISLQKDHVLPPVIPGISFVSVCVCEMTCLLCWKQWVCAHARRTQWVSTLYDSESCLKYSLQLFFSVKGKTQYSVWICSGFLHFTLYIIHECNR